MHPFDTAIQLKAEQNRFHGHTSLAYTNMVGPFGGITAATLLKALLDHPERKGEPITITVNFAAPVKDGAFAIETQLIRTNRSNQHWFVTLSQANAVVTMATAVFATRRETWGTTDLSFPSFPTNAELLSNSSLPGWTKNYTFHLAGGMAALFISKQKDKNNSHNYTQQDPPILVTRDTPTVTSLKDNPFLEQSCQMRHDCSEMILLFGNSCENARQLIEGLVPAATCP